jgi:serine/threonine protein kinase
VQLNPAVRCVAVKILSGGQAAERRRLDDEIQILGDLSHPGIARLLGAGKLDDGRPFYAMELCEGDRFDDWLETKQPTLRERVKVLRALSEAIAHAHQKGVSHRDLTPANVLVTELPGGEWQPKVIDFGLSRATEGLSRIGREETLEAHWAGTPSWMAPEQLAGAASGPPADLHALGLLLGLSLLGESPLARTISREGSWGEWIAARQNWTWPREPRLPRAARPLKWVAEKELSLSPQERSQSADLFGAELTRWLEGKPVRAGKGRLVYHIGRGLVQHPLAASVISLLLLVSITASIAWSLANQSPPAFQDHPANGKDKVRLQAENLHALAIADLQKGQVGTAYQMLEEALKLDPDNLDAQFSLNALRALAPFPKPLPDVTLPFVPKSLGKSSEGFLVRGFSGEQLLIDAKGVTKTAAEKGTPPSSEWNHPDGNWSAAIGTGGRVLFSNSDDGLPILHPIEFQAIKGKISVLPQSEQVAAIGPDRVLRRWDISGIGGTREQFTFSSKVTWMGFERGNSNLWLRHQNQEMRGWKEGATPGFAAKLPIFSAGMDTNAIGENHARGILHGWGPARMMAQLELWRRGGKGRAITCVAGAWDVDHLALAANNATLLWWTPQTALKAWKTTLAPPAVVAINGKGTRVLWCDQEGQVSWLDPVSQEILATRHLTTRPVAASMPDSKNPHDLAIIAGEDGIVRTIHPESATTLATMKMAGDLPGPHKVRIHSLRNHPWYLVGIQNGLTLKVIDALSGDERGDAIPLDHGLGHFFLSADGNTIIVIDQAETGPGSLRLISTKTRRDLIPPLTHPDRIIYAVISSDHRHLATSCADGTVRRWTFE